ncbi:hypothetical protein M569_09502 [Genlisea aurea]|uniref:TCP domain-containing protein n=1 Tax=Genlisea aurea TaxID=192259 RepID=S8CE85_9LAMI|nr:hypothetical protein M569_09502 [Genlisea aurea]
MNTRTEEGGSEQIQTTSSWSSSSYKNPRIVRVSRNFGGKDRHSKVCTVRGLRDRRIRLSVPTAIQLYDLQDRLGVSQPSKVVDWLLDATKEEIEKLPPLPMFPTSFPPELNGGNPMNTHGNNEGGGGGGVVNFYNFQIQNPYLHWDIHNLNFPHHISTGAGAGAGGGEFQLHDHHNTNNPQLYLCTSSTPITTHLVPSSLLAAEGGDSMRQMLLQNVDSRPLLNLGNGDECSEETSQGDGDSVN